MYSRDGDIQVLPRYGDDNTGGIQNWTMSQANRADLELDLTLKKGVDEVTSRGPF